MTQGELLVLGAGALMLSGLLTVWVRRLALKRGIMDAPNARSSHTRVTPRGGGIAIAAVAMIGVGIAWSQGWLGSSLALALMGGGLPIVWIGFMDDRRSVSPLLRFTVHILSAVWATYVLGGLAPVQVGPRLVDLGLAGDLAAVVAIVWVVNLFNFMDGIDGIAGTEAVFVIGMGSWLSSVVLSAPGVAAAGIVFVGACCGFLLWNWPPARIFMGDAGSGFLGFIIAVLAVAASRDAPVASFVWLILGGAFFVDATVTLVRRLIRRAAVYQAHREHAYQWLTRRWQSHRAALLLFIGVNLCWLAPCAWYAALHPERAAIVSLLALAPLVPAAIAVGAGRAE